MAITAKAVLVKAVLVEAKRIIQEKGWWPGPRSMQNGRVCVIQAIHNASYELKEREPSVSRMWLDQRANDVFCAANNCITGSDWNDAQATVEDVLAGFDKAISYEEAQV